MILVSEYTPETMVINIALEGREIRNVEEQIEMLLNSKWSIKQPDTLISFLKEVRNKIIEAKIEVNGDK